MKNQKNEKMFLKKWQKMKQKMKLLLYNWQNMDTQISLLRIFQIANWVKINRVLQIEALLDQVIASYSLFHNGQKNIADKKLLQLDSSM